MTIRSIDEESVVFSLCRGTGGRDRMTTAARVFMPVEAVNDVVSDLEAVVVAMDRPTDKITEMCGSAEGADDSIEGWFPGVECNMLP